MTQATSWAVALWTAIAAGFARLMDGIPAIIGAVLLLVVGWIVAGFIGSLVTRVARALRVDSIADRIGANGFLARSGAKITVSALLGEVFKWVIRLFFIEGAANQLGLPQVSVTIDKILGFVPNILVAALILAAGLFVAQLVRGIVRGASSEAGIGNAEALSRFAGYAIVAFAVIAALNELDVAQVVINTLFIGLVAALALAFGLAFGLGGRDVAARYAERWAAAADRTANRIPAYDRTEERIAGSAQNLSSPPPPRR